MAKRKNVSTRKRRLKSSEQKSRSSDHSPVTSNTDSVALDWLSSITTDHVNNNQSLENGVQILALEDLNENGETGLNASETEATKSCQGEYELLIETLPDNDDDMCKSSANGLKPNKFYGKKVQTYKFSFQKFPHLKNISTMENTKLKPKQNKGGNGCLKRKYQGQKDHETVDHSIKKTKKDANISVKEKVFSSSEKNRKIKGVWQKINKDRISNSLDIRLKENAMSGCDVINNNKNHTSVTTLESSSSSSSSSPPPPPPPSSSSSLSPTSEETNVQSSNFGAETVIDDDVSELGSLHSKCSITSGLSSVSAFSLFKGQNKEFYFTSSSESSPELNTNGSLKLIETPTSLTASPDKDFGSEDKSINKSGLLFDDKEIGDSSYSPSYSNEASSSCSGSIVVHISPEHQTSITSFFKKSTKEINTVISPKSKKPERTKKKTKKKMEQMYLDLGQRDFGHVTCSTCGMVYTCAQPDDEIEHIRHHKKFVNGLKFNGWKHEHVVKEFHDGRIIMVKPDDHSSHLKKVEEIREVVDSELGFAVDLPYRKKESKTFLFISNKKVVGCCVATQIDKGYPVLPSTPSKDSTPERQIAAWCCSTVPVPAQCGISKIWVWNQYRRKRVATRLIDCVRSQFIYGCTIAKESLAFSDPTPDGKRLATTYIGTQEFLVFR